MENAKFFYDTALKNLNVISRYAGVDWLTITTSDPTRRTSVLKRFLRLKEAGQATEMFLRSIALLRTAHLCLRNHPARYYGGDGSGRLGKGC